MKNYLDITSAERYAAYASAASSFCMNLPNTGLPGKSNFLNIINDVTLNIRSRILDGVFKMKPGMTPELELESAFDYVLMLWRLVRAHQEKYLHNTTMPLALASSLLPSPKSTEDLKSSMGDLFYQETADFSYLATSDVLLYSLMLLNQAHTVACQQYIAAITLIELGNYGQLRFNHNITPVHEFLRSEIKEIYGLMCLLELIVSSDHKRTFNPVLYDSPGLANAQALVRSLHVRRGGDTRAGLELIKTAQARMMGQM